jgi:hypothetical protein
MTVWSRITRIELHYRWKLLVIQVVCARHQLNLPSYLIIFKFVPLIYNNLRTAISKAICRFGVAIGIVFVTHLLGRSKAWACENSDVLRRCYV